MYKRQELSITREELNVVSSKARCTAVPVALCLLKAPSSHYLSVLVFVCGTRMGADFGARCERGMQACGLRLIVGIDAATSFLRHAVGRRPTTSGT